MQQHHCVFAWVSQTGSLRVVSAICYVLVSFVVDKKQIKMVIGIQYQRNVYAFSGSVRVQIVQEITKLCILKRFEYLQSTIKLCQCPIITMHVPLMKSSSHKTLSGALSRITNGCCGPSCGSNYCNSDLLPRHPAAMMLVVVTHSAVPSPILRKSLSILFLY